MTTLFKTFLLLSTCISLLSCSTEPGTGGSSSVQGKVIAQYYNNTFTIYIGSGYAQDKEVYLIAGDDETYGEQVSTNYNGSFLFTNLRKGKYKIYIYSKDSTFTSPSGMTTVFSEFEITKNNQQLLLEDIQICL